MVGVIRRMNKLTERLLGVRHGPGAAVLPSEITRIHLEFAAKWNDGHLGPRKFWRECLPRLKYWNPAVPMIVNRTTNQAGPAIMSVYFRQSSSSPGTTASTANPDPSSTSSSSSPPQTTLSNTPSSSMQGRSPAPPPLENERVVAVQMKGVHSDRILRDLIELTGAVPVAPTPQEEAAMRDVQDRKERGEADREVMRQHLEAERREARMMAQARNEAAAMKASA